MPVAKRRARVLREVAIFTSFVALTVVMTWPWVLHLRNGVADPGDSYLNAWTLWWDFHATFHDPLHLFDANIFYPYEDTLAFSEHDYGIALILFPLYALGARPLTAVSVATLLAIASSGYAAFRLTRTLTGSAGAGAVAGVAFAFVPFRFMHLTHVNYMFTAWIPLSLEALVLAGRNASRGRVAWWGAAFLMNALTCIHWFVLTLVPLLTAGFVAGARAADPRRFARRVLVASGVALVLLLPFFLPYARVAERFGFVRSADEARTYSAHWIHWITPTENLRVWRNSGIGDVTFPWERCLFPGLLTSLLALTAFFAWRNDSPRAPQGARPRSRPVAAAAGVLDVLAALAALVALLSWSSPFALRLGGWTLLKASSPDRALAVLSAAGGLRVWLAWPSWMRTNEPNLRESLRRPSRPEGFLIAATWVVLGVLGSLGMNFPFHRVLFDLFGIFRSIRVPARWAIVADLGLAVLAGAGACALVSRLPLGKRGRTAAYAVPVLAVLFELHVAPVVPMAGEGEADQVTQWLRRTTARGGIVELPSDDTRENLWVLRAADHRKPLVNAISGFKTPVALAVERFSTQTPVPRGFMRYLEAVPVSFVTVHDDFLTAAQRTGLRDFLGWAWSSGRLRFVRRFTDRRTVDLFAVVRTEPAGEGSGRPPWVPDPTGDTSRDDPALTGSVDEPAEGAVVTGDLRVRGWARIPAGDLEVTLLIDGEESRPDAFVRVRRSDVCSAVPGLGDCGSAGFEATFRPAFAKEGVHEIVAVFTSCDGRRRHYTPRAFRWQAIRRGSGGR